MHNLLSFFTAPATVTAVGIAFVAMLVLNAVLHVLVYANPRGIVPYNALPWAFQIRWNLDLDFQTVTYAAVHDTRMARWTHLTMPAEQVAWAIVLLWLHPLALGLVIGFVICQALVLNEPPLAVGLVLMWAVVGGLAYGCLHFFGPAALTASEVLLLVGPFLRFLGHAFEPIPPFIATPQDVFIPLSQARLRPSFLAVGVSGVVSEFAAALPHRLIVVQLFWLAQQLGYAPRQASGWGEARRLGAAIRAQGWKAYEKTRRLFRLDAPAFAASRVASDA